MNLNSLLQGTGGAGQFSSRIFLPALVTALLLRFGPQIPIIDHMGLIAMVKHGQPTWFTSNISLIALTVLSVLEILAQKNPEARQILHEVDIYIKPVMAALTAFGYMRSQDAAFISSTAQAGYVNDVVPILSAFLTYRLSILRKRVTQTVFDHVEGTHLDHLLSWLEDAWAIFGTLLLVLLPLLMLATLAAVWGTLFFVRRRLKVSEENARIVCSACGQSIYPCAIACPACKQASPSPHDIGMLGQSVPYPSRDPYNHVYRLLEKRRCPVCAAHQPPRQALSPCAECGHIASSPEFIDAYVDYISQRLPVVLCVCFLLSLVPILGLIASSVYSRMQLGLPFSQYLPLGKNFVLRWSVRILFLVLIFLQLVPVLGGLVGPVMAYVCYAVYRNAYVGLMKQESPLGSDRH